MSVSERVHVTTSPSRAIFPPYLRSAASLSKSLDDAVPHLEQTLLLALKALRADTLAEAIHQHQSANEHPNEADARLYQLLGDILADEERRFCQDERWA